MLGRNLVPSGYFRGDCAGRIGFRNDAALLLSAPAPSATHTGPDVNTSTALRRVNYMVNHICEPISSTRFTSSASPPHPERVGKEDRLRSKKWSKRSPDLAQRNPGSASSDGNTAPAFRFAQCGLRADCPIQIRKAPFAI